MVAYDDPGSNWVHACAGFPVSSDLSVGFELNRNLSADYSIYSLGITGNLAASQ